MRQEKIKRRDNSGGKKINHVLNCLLDCYGAGSLEIKDKLYVAKRLGNRENGASNRGCI